MGNFEVGEVHGTLKYM